LTAKPRFHSSELQFSIVAATPTPALLTSTESPPIRSCAASSAASQSARWSHQLDRKGGACAQFGVDLRGLLGAPSALRSASSTFAPSRASIAQSPRQDPAPRR
jgi:hypothetical protein